MYKGSGINLRLVGVGVIFCAWLLGAAFADTRIVLDVSKSMAENDPENFRGEAIELLIDALPAGEKAGIWTFGQFVNLLVPHESVNTNWRANAREKIRQLKAPAIRSNMGRALEEVSYDFLYSSYQGPTQVIFITDGRVDIAPNSEVNRVERDRIISQLLPRFAAANAQIHTVVLSKDADHTLLKQMSAQSGGRYQLVEKSSQLTQIMAGLPGQAKPVSQVPLSDQGFTLDASVRELTLLMYHDSGAVSLMSPEGQTTSAVAPARQSWRVGRGFSQVTITDPAAGRWQVMGQINDASNIRVISDINVDWQQPEASALAIGDVVMIEARLSDGDDAVLFSDNDELIEAQVRVDGRLVSSSIESGQIKSRFTPEQGQREVLVELLVDGGTFKRLVTRSFRFVEPFMSEVVLTEQGYEWRLYPNTQIQGAKPLQAMAEYQMNGTTRNSAFEQSPAGYWVWVFPYDQPNGQYEVSLKSKAMAGAPALTQETIRLDIPPNTQGGFVMTPEAMPMLQANSNMPQNQPMASSDEFIKDPILEFPELQADVVIGEPNADDWQDEADMPTKDASGMGLSTYLLLSLPGLLVLGAAYFVYRQIEQRAKSSSSEEEMILGGDEFSGLDDIDALAPDSDLDLSSIEGDEDDMPPMIDDIIEEDLPTPEKTEAPSIAEEDMLDEQAPSEEAETPSEPEEDSEEELFDISSIDDDLADLDLALDGDDPFADDEEKP